MTLEERAEAIIKEAEANELENNYFFLTTFERYRVQIGILEELRKEIEEGEALITKEYVKGRGNVYTNPAITAYNSTADSTNKTVNTLLKILRDFEKTKKKKSEEEEDPLLAIINAGGED